MILAAIDYSWAFHLSGAPLFSTNLYWLASLLAWFDELNLSFMTDALARFLKPQNALPLGLPKFLGKVSFGIFSIL